MSDPVTVTLSLQSLLRITQCMQAYQQICADETNILLIASLQGVINSNIGNEIVGGMPSVVAQSASQNSVTGGVSAVAGTAFNIGLPLQYLPVGLADYSRAQATVQPLISRPGLTLNNSALAKELYFTDYHDPSVTSDCTTALQNFLLYCQQIAVALKPQNLENLFYLANVKEILPRGCYFISSPICLPEMVDLQCDGVIVTNPPYTGSSSTFYTGDTTSNGLNQIYQPAIICTARSSVSKLNLMLAWNGAPTTKTNSGIVMGKNWGAATILFANIGRAYE